MRKPLSHHVYSITDSKIRMEMPLVEDVELRITNVNVYVSVIANLHDNSWLETFLHRISIAGSSEMSGEDNDDSDYSGQSLPLSYLSDARASDTGSVSSGIEMLYRT